MRLEPIKGLLEQVAHLQVDILWHLVFVLIQERLTLLQVGTALLSNVWHQYFFHLRCNIWCDISTRPYSGRPILLYDTGNPKPIILHHELGKSSRVVSDHPLNHRHIIQP